MIPFQPAKIYFETKKKILSLPLEKVCCAI